MSDKGHELTDKKLKQLEGELKQLYKQASDEVEKKLDDYLKAFKAKDAKHQADLQKDFTKENYEEYIRWRQGQVLISERWEEMRQSLAEDYHRANMAAKSVIDGYMPDIYALNHNYGTYDVEHKGLVDTSYTLYDRQTVERLMRDNPDMLPPPGKKVSKRIAEGKDVLWNKAQIQASMWQSVTQGESMDKIAQRLAQTVGDKDMAAAVRNARTMTTGAECAGRVDSYKRAEDMGIQLQQEWMSTLDGRTRHSHRELHGERIDVDGTFSNGCRFPGDPSGDPEEIYNCRCTLVAAIKGFEGDKVTSSPKMGDMSFEEWVGEHEESTSDTVNNQSIDKEQESDIIKNIELPPETDEVRSMSEDTKNQISEAFDKIQSEYIIEVDEFVTEDLGKDNKNVPFQFQPSRGKDGELIKRFVINSKYDFMGTQEKFQKRIMRNFNKGVLASNSVLGLIAHELAHVMTFQDISTFSGYLFEQKRVAKEMVYGISLYADSKNDGAECIAEAFAAKMCGLEISDEAQDLLDKYIEKRRKV